MLEIYDNYLSFPSTFIISTVFILSATFLRPVLADYLPKLHYYRILRLSYVYAYAIFSILQWRDYWIFIDDISSVEYNSQDKIIGVNLKSLLIMGCGSIAMLFSMKCIATVVSTPFLLTLDDIEPYYFPTRFRFELVSANLLS